MKFLVKTKVWKKAPEKISYPIIVERRAWMSNDLKVSIKPRFSCLLPLQEKIEFGHSGLGGVGKVKFFVILKSVNLQYNTLCCLDDGTNESSTKRLMFQVLFFSWFLAKFFAKILSIHFLIFLYKITKIKIKSFECPKSTKSMKK